MIYKGNKELVGARWRGKELVAVYKGAKEIWVNGIKAYDLGNGQTFNVASVYADYQNLTADNFMFVGADTMYVSSASYQDETQTLKMELLKSYNAQTGQLNMQLHYYASRGGRHTYSNCRVYLIPDISKLVSLGTGNSFDCKSIRHYQDLSANNFFIQNMSAYTWSLHCYVHDCSFGGGLTKSYNAQNGTLRFYQRDRDNGVSGNLTVYYATKIV